MNPYREPGVQKPVADGPRVVHFKVASPRRAVSIEHRAVDHPGKPGKSRDGRPVSAARCWIIERRDTDALGGTAWREVGSTDPYADAFGITHIDASIVAALLDALATERAL